MKAIKLVLVCLGLVSNALAQKAYSEDGDDVDAKLFLNRAIPTEALIEKERVAVDFKTTKLQDRFLG